MGVEQASFPGIPDRDQVEIPAIRGGCIHHGAAVIPVAAVDHGGNPRPIAGNQPDWVALPGAE
ncbi:MAG: hypothetical protein GWO24_03775 [Akkermansiaceae bacterium]|nr:hypothetical protein [Akkermansiaceae bacterium]